MTLTLTPTVTLALALTLTLTLSRYRVKGDDPIKLEVLKKARGFGLGLELG